jgi:hypothetical protein
LFWELWGQPVTVSAPPAAELMGGDVVKQPTWVTALVLCSFLVMFITTWVMYTRSANTAVFSNPKSLSVPIYYFFLLGESEKSEAFATRQTNRAICLFFLQVSSI